MRLSGKMYGAAAKAGQRRLVEARQDQLLLARIGVHVAHREDARRAGLELLGVDDDLLALEVQAPLGDRAQLGLRPKNTSSTSSGTRRVTPSLPVTFTLRQLPLGSRSR
jgi:hypothetical protein